MLRQYLLDLLYIIAMNHDSFLHLPYWQIRSDDGSNQHVKKANETSY
jgi:hypothetical protein